VFSRDRHARIYSRRMVSDAKRAAIARKNGKTGGNPSLTKDRRIPAQDNPLDKGELKTQEPTAIIQIEQEVSDANASSPADPPSALVGPRPRKAKSRPGGELVETLWSLQPVTGGKRKATRPDVAKALQAALDRGGEPADIEAAFRAYYALPDCRKDGGQFASGAAVLLSADRWRDFLPGTDLLTSPTAPWPGPPDLRAAIVAAPGGGEDFARNYVDPSGWLNDPDRIVLCRTAYAAEKLNLGVPEVLAKHTAKAIFSPPPALS
jgi:hypothetical protein